MKIMDFELEAMLLCDEFTCIDNDAPRPKPATAQDEYAFIEQSLQRYRDRDYRKE